MFKRFFTSVSRIFCNLFTINVISRYKRHIVVITLISILACCTIVLYPRLNKPSLPSFGQTQLKFFYSGLELGKFGVEEKLNFCISGPIYGDGIKSIELGKNLTPKDSSNNIKGVVILHGERDAVAKPSHNKSTASTEQPEVGGGKCDSENYHVLWSLLPMYIVTLCWIFYILLFCT